jgi:SAM-dependent methyltransferase
VTDRRARRSHLDVAAARYRDAGRFAMHFARGKLAGDPVFTALLQRGLARDGALLDLGCGQGLLAAWLSAARERHDAGVWPDGWAPPPRLASYTGIELMAADVQRARQALRGCSEDIRLVEGDVRTTAFGRVDTIVILDVLHYLAPAEQDDVLRRARGALDPGGVLLIRIGDAAGGISFRWSNWVDRIAMLARGHGWNPLHCRPLAQWQAALARLGLTAEALPMSEGTLFSNVLLVARIGNGVRLELT